jgi:uncharacterized membrane protein YkoI
LKTLIISILFSLTFLLQASIAAEMPPQNAKPLSEIVRILEEQGYSPIVDIEFDDARWEVEAYNEGVKRELRVDPASGQIISDRKDN